MFGSNGRTRSVTRRVYPRECERRDARARELAHYSTLEHYLLLLTLCVVHARKPLQLMIAADDVVVGRCHALSAAVWSPFRTLPPFGLTVNYATAAAATPGISLLASGPSRDGPGDGQARAEKRQQQQQAQRRWYRQRHPMRSHRIVVARAPSWHTLPAIPPQPHIRHSHTKLTFSLRGTAFRPRRDGLASSSQRRVVIRN